MGGIPDYRSSEVSSIVSIDLNSSWAAKSWDSARYFSYLENKVCFDYRVTNKTDFIFNPHFDWRLHENFHTNFQLLQPH